MSNIKNCEPKIRPRKNHENFLTILRFEGHYEGLENNVFG